MITCLVNLYELNPPANGGLALVARQVAQFLQAQFRGRSDLMVYFALGPGMTTAEFLAWSGCADANVVSLLAPEERFRLARTLAPDVIVSPLFGMTPFEPEDNLAAAQVACIPDAQALDLPGHFPDGELERRRRIYQDLERADGVVTISEFSSRSLQKHLAIPAERITVAPLAAAGFDGGAEGYAAASMPDLRPYYFYPANCWPHKRHGLLIEIMQAVWRRRPEMNLALTGDCPHGYLAALLEQHGADAARIHHLGYVPAPMLPGLYRRAEALVFPSEYEGFGMPVLEAMQFGCPVVCAPLGSLPEVAGEAALYVEGDDPAAWAAVLLDELDAARETLIAKGLKRSAQFSWETHLERWRGALEKAGLAFEGGQAGISPGAGGEGNPEEVRRGLQAIVQSQLGKAKQRAAALKTRQAGLEMQLEELERQIAARDTDLHLYRRSRVYWLLSGPLRGFPVFSSLAPRATKIYEALQPRIDGNHRHYLPRELAFPAAYGTTALRDPNAAPAISIVTPSFNQGEFVERAVRSVLAQEYPNLEYRIQDGGSTDSTLPQLEKYAGRIAALESTPDGGQADALNRGFAGSSGEIMAFLNSDDAYPPGTLNYVANYFAAHPAVDAVYGHRIIIDAWDKEVGRWVLPPHDDEALRWFDFVPQETLFWRRRIWEQVSAHLDERFKFALDWDLLLRFQEAGARFARLPRFLGCFRIHPQQKTKAQIALGNEEMQAVLARQHGRPVSWEEVHRRIHRYQRRSVVFHLLYRLGALRY